MGCKGSKAENTSAVIRCRTRRAFIRDAVNYRYALAAAHVSYFRSLEGVGDAIQKFFDEGQITADSDSSGPPSPHLTLPRNSKQGSGGGSPHLLDCDDDEDYDGSHLNLSDSEDGDEGFAQHLHDSDDNIYQDQHHTNPHHHGRGSEHDMHQNRYNSHTNPHHEDDMHQHHHNYHPNRGSEDDMHQHHHNKPRNRKKKEDFFDDDVSHLRSEDESSSNFYPRGGFNGFGGDFSGFGNGFGGGMDNEPHSNPNHYPNPYQYPYGEPHVDHWGPEAAAPQPWYYSKNTNVHYMKKGAPAAYTVFEEPPAELSYGYSNSYSNPAVGFGHSGDYGYFSNENVRVNQKKETPPPPSPPKAWGWDFFDPFVNNEYYSSGRHEYWSNSISSPDSTGVREREGIPDLEEETESEMYKKEAPKGKKWKNEAKMDHSNYNSESGSSRKFPLPKNNGKSKQVPKQNRESSSKSVPSWSSEENAKPYKGADNAKKKYTPPSQPSVLSPHGEGTPSVVESLSGEIDSSDCEKDGSSSRENFGVENTAKRKGVSFEVGEASRQDGDSSKLSSATISSPKLSSVTISSPRGTRDLGEAVAEIRDEFKTAASYGKEVAVMLEVGKVPYQPSFLKAIISQILFPFSTSLSSRDPPSMQTAKLASKTMKLAKSYFDDVGKDENAKACNLSSTLDKLYAWEKKLYKEVKGYENLQLLYEKQRRRLKNLDEEGADPTKIDTARTSIRRLGTKLNVSVRGIEATSTSINKLRDEELHPQVAELIHGLIRMWKAMLKCHQKQFQALKESKMGRLKVNTSLQIDPTSRATTELERELCAWCDRFNDWIASQKSYVESLNGWLMHWLLYEPEETPDGPVPYSPGHLGAPPVFEICNDWHQSMNAISKVGVSNAMNTFAENLRQLWIKQEEEVRQRLIAEYLSREYEKQQKEQQPEEKGKTGLSVVASDDRDDLPVDLDKWGQKLTEERVKHADAMKLLDKAASTSLQGGLIPIFKALEVFSSEALKAHEQVRLHHPGLGL